MPPPLTPADRERLGKRLRARHRELKAEIRAQLADRDDPGVIGLANRLEDTDDWAVADAMAGLDIAMVARDVDELTAVEGALKRLSDGRYGECVDCGEPIALARLDANPSAARCIRCQEAWEKKAGATPTSL